MLEIKNKLAKVFNLKCTKSKVEHILNNPFYYGMMRYDGQLYPHEYDRIISKELFDAVQDVKARYNKKEI